MDRFHFIFVTDLFPDCFIFIVGKTFFPHYLFISKKCCNLALDWNHTIIFVGKVCDSAIAHLILNV